VLTNGAFQLALPRVAARSNRLSLTILHANGETWSELLEWKVDRLGKSNLSELNSEWLVDRAEIAVVEGDPQARTFLGDDSLAAVTQPEAGRKLRVLRGVLDPVAPVELAAAKADQQDLSDAAWTEANVGWGKVRGTRSGSTRRIPTARSCWWPGNSTTKAFTPMRRPRACFRSRGTGKPSLQSPDSKTARVRWDPRSSP
jgi:hypothetical protein